LCPPISIADDHVDDVDDDDDDDDDGNGAS
jgi:hypothetical protein